MKSKHNNFVVFLDVDGVLNASHKRACKTSHHDAEVFEIWTVKPHSDANAQTT